MHSSTVVELKILSSFLLMWFTLTISLSYRTTAMFIYVDTNVLMANSSRGWLCMSVGQFQAWHCRGTVLVPQ